VPPCPIRPKLQVNKVLHPLHSSRVFIWEPLDSVCGRQPTSVTTSAWLLHRRPCKSTSISVPVMRILVPPFFVEFFRSNSLFADGLSSTPGPYKSIVIKSPRCPRCIAIFIAARRRWSRAKMQESTVYAFTIGISRLRAPLAKLSAVSQIVPEPSLKLSLHFACEKRISRRFLLGTAQHATRRCERISADSASVVQLVHQKQQLPQRPSVQSCVALLLHE